jgi:hypothetical protein
MILLLLFLKKKKIIIGFVRGTSLKFSNETYNTINWITNHILNVMYIVSS